MVVFGRVMGFPVKGFPVYIMHELGADTPS